MFCTKCGTQVQEGRQFCGNCGTALRRGSASNANPPVSPAPAPVKQRTPWSIAKKLTVLALVCVAAGAAGGYWWWQHRPIPGVSVAPSIRRINFQDFSYPTGCYGYPALIPVVHGKWKKGNLDYEVAPPKYAKLLDTNHEQAVIVAHCFLGMWADTEVFVYGMHYGKPVLIQRLGDSAWAPEGCWMETVQADLKNGHLVVGFLSGGIHAQPAWRVTVTMKWNGTRFVRGNIVKKPFQA